MIRRVTSKISTLAFLHNTVRRYTSKKNKPLLSCASQASRVSKPTLADHVYKEVKAVLDTLVATGIDNISDEDIKRLKDAIQGDLNLVQEVMLINNYPNYKDDIPFQNLNVVKAMGEHLLRNCKVKREGLSEDSLCLLANFSFDGFGKTRIGIEFLELWKQCVSSHQEYRQELINEFGESSFNQLFTSELIYLDVAKEYAFSEFDFERLSRTVPSDEDKSYFIVFDEVPLFCSKGKT